MDLVVEYEFKQIERVTLELQPEEKLSIGRSQENDIVLENRKTSRHHAEITMRGEDDYWIDDNDSLNGTFVNNLRIVKPQQLHYGDLIIIGAYIIVVAHS
jgi:pSer/pThr/pTyr-binding forkhead associated (FHA) protein